MPAEAETEAKIKPKSNLDFKLMSLAYRIRDFIGPLRSILDEVGIREGFTVLDYGCGPGSYVGLLAEMVGKSGCVYAVDINPLAVQTVQRLASKKALNNVCTVLSDCETGLPSLSIDAVLLYDVLHCLDKPDWILAELHRVLKPKGIPSVSDHHTKHEEIIFKVTIEGLFKLSAKGKRTYNFLKRG